MNDFVEWIKGYIADEFNADNDIEEQVDVRDAYKQGNEVSTSQVPQIQIQIMDNSTVESHSSFDGEHVSYIPLQINAYTGITRIGGKQVPAQKSSIIFGDKLKAMLNKLRKSVVNKNISRCQVTAMSPALEHLDGSKVYYTATRCEFWVNYPYITE